jgi:hypothetical protein
MRIQIALTSLNKSQSNDPQRVSILRKELGAIDKIRNDLVADASFLSNLDESITASKKELTVKEEELKSDFGLKLDQLLKELNLKLEGQYPILHTSFYRLNIDIPSNKVTIYFGPGVEKVGITKAIPDDVVNSLAKLNKNIIDRQFDEQEFMKTIFSAYQTYNLQNKKRIGDEAPLADIHKGVVFLVQTDNFRKNPTKNTLFEYTRAMFSYDLSRLKKRVFNNFELRLITATRADTRSSGEFFWIPTSGVGMQGETVARIKFSEVIK